MKKIVPLVVCVITFLLLAVSDSFACLCAQSDFDPSPPSNQQVTKARKRAKAVFSGEVIEITKNTEGHFVRVKFRADKVWKGAIPETITVLTGGGTLNCGYPFEIGQSYLVYASKAEDNNILSTGTCERTIKIAAASEELEILGKGSKPKKKSSEAFSSTSQSK